MKRKEIKGLYLILDQQYTNKDIISIAIEATEAGVDIIQYREKVSAKKDALAIARRLRQITEKAGVTFIINDDPIIAFAVDADGVHLGQEDIPVDVARKILGQDKIIGISTHNDQEISGALSLDLDYIGFGPVFHSSTKMIRSSHGIEGIRKIRDRVSLPIIAIGGINLGNVTDVINAGADGAAVISGVLSAADIRQCVFDFRQRINRLFQQPAKRCE